MRGKNADLYVLKYTQRMTCLRSQKFSKESGELLENSNSFNFDELAMQELCIECITLFDNLAMKYENHRAEDTIQVQAETLCVDVEMVESDLEQDSTCCFNDDTSDVDWVENQVDIFVVTLR